jgi:integrase
MLLNVGIHDSALHSIPVFTRTLLTMSTPSRMPPDAWFGPSLADVAVLVAKDDFVPNRRRHDIASALQTVSKVLQKPLDAIPAQPVLLRGLLHRALPAAAAIKPARWRNVVSLTRAALHQSNLAHIPGRAQQPLSPDWAAAITLLPTRHLRFGLSRLASYCSDRSIAPHAVNDALMDRFKADIEVSGLIRNPREVHRRATVEWNKAAETVAGWPQARLIVPNYGRTYAIPWDRFPASLKADVDAWFRRLAGEILVADDDSALRHSCRPLRPKSIETRRKQLHEYLSALVIRGRDPASLTCLADVVTLPAIRDGLRFFLDRAGNKPSVQAGHVGIAIKAVAQHYVGVPDADLKEIRALVKRVTPCHDGITERNRARLRPFDDVRHRNALLNLPQRLLDVARRLDTPARRGALLVQAAVAIELLLMAPIRLGNLHRLKLGEQLLRHRNGTFRIVLRADEVKNRKSYEVLLQPPTARLIDLYLTDYRLRLIATAEGYLFPGRAAGAPKSPEMLRRQIIRTVRDHCGLEMNPHLFRHLAVLLTLQEQPGAYGQAALVLGHGSYNTTVKYYSIFETKAALEHYGRRILRLREGDADKVPLRRGRG